MPCLELSFRHFTSPPPLSLFPSSSISSPIGPRFLSPHRRSTTRSPSPSHMILMAQPPLAASIHPPIPPSPHSVISIPAPAPAHPSDPAPAPAFAHIVPTSLASRSSQHTARSRSSNDSSSRSRLSTGKRASTGSGSRRGSSKSKGRAHTSNRNNILLNGTSAVDNPILSPPAAALVLNGSGSRNSPSLNAIADPKRTSTTTISQMKHTTSCGRAPRLSYASSNGLLSGTIQRSKVGGRVAATSSSYLGGTGKSLYDSHARSRAQDQALYKRKAKETERDVSVLPTPTSVASVHRPSPMQQHQQDKPTSYAQAPTTTANGNSHVPSTRRSSSSARSRKSNGSGKAAKLVGQGLLGAGVSASKRPFDTEYSDDSSDTDWTDDGSDEGSGAGLNNEPGCNPEEAEDEPGAEAQAEHDRMLAFAAAEEQRERSLFTKLDKRSYTDLNRSRTQPSLLSMIFHPDPQLFPPDHPYRHTRSTQDILAHAVAPRASLSSAATSSTTVSHAACQPAKLQTISKSTMAGPVQAMVVASSVSTSNMTQEGGQPRQRSPLRLRGKPANVDVEESDSESEANDLHMSKSIAHQRLAMLHNQQNGRRATATGQTNGKAPQLPLKMRTEENVAVTVVRPAALARVATEPITMQYPYNLPAPQLPSTPRTTRRTMLTHELSESLRRNLLWERQVSRLRPVGNGVYRRNSAGTAHMPNGTVNGSASGSSAASGNGNGSNSRLTEEETTRRRLERNKSWADTFHTNGW